MVVLQCPSNLKCLLKFFECPHCQYLWQQDGLANSEKAHSNKDKGIEMDDDFEADTFSVSEDSEVSDNDEDEDINLESKMGETGDDKQVVDEKLWNKDEDDKPDNSSEKYESGPSVEETKSRDRELRAKQDDVPSLDESEELKSAGPEELHEEDEDNISDDENNIDDMSLDKNNVFEDSTGIQLNEGEQDLDETKEEAQDAEMQENDSGSGESDDEMNPIDEQSNATDHADDENPIHADDNIETQEGAEDADNTSMDVESSKENAIPDKTEPSDYSALGADSLQQASDLHEADFSSEPDKHWSNSSDMNNNLAPSRNSPFDEIPNADVSIPDSGDGSRLAPEKPKSQVPQGDSSPILRSQSNPYRSLGDAMEEWKERAKVSVEPQESQGEGPDDINQEDADEYKYVSEVERSTSQALGSATSDQINDNLDGKRAGENEGDVRKKEEVDKMDCIEEDPKTQHLTSTHPSIPKQKADKPVLNTVAADDESIEELQQDTLKSFSGDMVSFKSLYMNEKILPLDTLNGTDKLKPMDVEELSDDVKQIAVADWKRYEFSTAKLSQELTEHLRLVMEPTLASKLQGDYRTGKRINMKKVSSSSLFC